MACSLLPPPGPPGRGSAPLERKRRAARCGRLLLVHLVVEISGKISERECSVRPPHYLNSWRSDCRESPFGSAWCYCFLQAGRGRTKCQASRLQLEDEVVRLAASPASARGCPEAREETWSGTPSPLSQQGDRPRESDRLLVFSPAAADQRSQLCITHTRSTKEVRMMRNVNARPATGR